MTFLSDMLWRLYMQKVSKLGSYFSFLCLTRFLDENHHSRASVFVSTIRMHSDKPILFLEEFEDSFADIQCSLDGIDLTFPSSLAFSAAMATWEELREAIVISSHKGCNEEGSRAAYRYVCPTNMLIIDD
jgi:hypothetical protein